MKKLAVLLLIIIAAIFTVPALADEVKVKKPELPKNYANWPFKYKNSCEVTAVVSKDTVELSAFIEIIDYKEKRLGIVIRIKINNKDMFWLHGIGTKYELNSGYAYLKNNSEWNKYDLSNKENMEKIRNYLNEKFSSGPCDKLNEGLEKSLDSLLYKESTK